MNLKQFPRHSLTFGPTPIHPLSRLSESLGGKVELYAKREDCNSGLAFGGNKTRKLEYVIPDVLAQGAIRWSRSAGSSRTTRAGCRHRGPPGAEVRAGAGELGQLLRRGL